jgi:hypothetical protein
MYLCKRIFNYEHCHPARVSTQVAKSARIIGQENIRPSYQCSDCITAERFSAAYSRWAAALFF